MPPLISVINFKYTSVSEQPAAPNDGAYVDSTYALIFGGMYNVASVQQEMYEYVWNVRSPSIDEFAIDSLGNIYTIVSAKIVGGYGQYDLIVTKIRNDGTVTWCKTIGTALTEIPGAIAIDQYDNVFLAYGAFAVNLSGSSEPDTLILSKLDPAGTVMWSAQYTFSELLWPDSLSVSSSGLYLSGRTQNHPFMLKCSLSGAMLWCKTSYAKAQASTYQVPSTLDGATGVFFSGNSTSGMPFLARYTIDGIQSWVKNMSAQGLFVHICHDGSGNVVAVGSEGGSNPGALIVKFAADGTVLWSTGINRMEYASARCKHVCVDANGDIYVVGGYTLATSPVYPIAFIAKFSAAGTKLWQKITTSPTCTMLCAEIGSDGALYVSVTLNARNAGTESLTSTYRSNTSPGEYSRPALLKMHPDGTFDVAPSSVLFADRAINQLKLSLSSSSASYTSAAVALVSSSAAARSSELPVNSTTILGTKVTTVSRAIGFVCTDDSGNTYSISYGYGLNPIIQKYNSAGAFVWEFAISSVVPPIGIACNASVVCILCGSSSGAKYVAGYSAADGHVLFDKSLTPGQTIPPVTGQYAPLSIIDNHLISFQSVSLTYNFAYLMDLDLATYNVTAGYKTTNAPTMTNQHTAIGVLGDDSGNRHLFIDKIGTTVWRISTSGAYQTALSTIAYQQLLTKVAYRSSGTTYLAGATLETAAVKSTQTPVLAAFTADRTLLWAKTYDFGPSSAVSGIVATDSEIWLSVPAGLLKLNMQGTPTAFYPIPAYGTLSLVGDSIRIHSSGEPVFLFNLSQLAVLEEALPCIVSDYAPVIVAYTETTWQAESWTTLDAVGYVQYATPRASNVQGRIVEDVKLGITSLLES